jgi:anti-sigma factor RsiW
MEALPPERLAPVPLRTRIREWFGGSFAAAPGGGTADGHLGGDLLQDLVDGALTGGKAAAADRHLATCRLCRDELEAWRGIMVQLDQLPRLAPSPAFRERVLAHVRVQQAATVAQPTLAERLRGFLDRVSPRTRRRLAAVAGMAVTPAVTVALVAWTVFSHPLVTPASLVSFLWLKGRGALEAAGSAVAGRLSDQAVLVETFGVVGQLAQTPLAAAGTLLLLTLATSAAAWVLYQNLILHRATGAPHVQLLS